MKVYNNAGYLTYLLDLFEGKISLNDLLYNDVSLIMSMREDKEQQLKKRSQAIKKMNTNNAVQSLTPTTDSGNDIGYLAAIPNIN